MTFKKDIRNRQKSGSGGVLVVTSDETACLRQLRESLDGEFWHWNTALGWTVLTDEHEQHPVDSKDDTVKGVFETLLDNMRVANHGIGRQRSKAQVRVFFGVDAVLEQSSNARRLLLEATRAARADEDQSIFLVIVTGAGEVHPELRELPVLRHPLPSLEETTTAMEEWAEELDVDVRFDGSQARAAKMLVGLTDTQQMSALSLALASSVERKGKKPYRELPIDVLRLFKESEVAKLGYLRVKTPQKKLSDIVGHGKLKRYIRARRDAFSNPEFKSPKGIILVGPPGTGKSRIVEGVAAEWGFSLLEFDVGAVFSKWLGETDAQMRQALDIAQRMAPCIFFVDEADTAFGESGGGEGTANRILGKFQTWMASNEREGVFVIFTSNFPQKLPAALTRKGRFNQIFFMDFPSLEERESIFEYYAPDLPEGERKELAHATKGWAPAEIEAAVEEARMQAAADQEPFSKAKVDVEIADTTPVSKSKAKDIEIMREWAKEYARPTSTKEKEVESDEDWAYVDDDE